MLLYRISAVSRTLVGRTLVSHGQSWGSRLAFGGCRALCTGESCVHPPEVGSTSLYRDTVLLPQTDFPMKVTGQKLLDQEVDIQKVNRTTV